MENATSGEGPEQEATPQELQSLQLPLNDEQVAQLHAGEWYALEGSMYLISWKASQKLLIDAQNGVEWPFTPDNAFIFHGTVNPAPWGKVIGSFGPEYTSRFYEADRLLLEQGARGFLGRGPKADPLIDALKLRHGVYLTVASGTAALLARAVQQSEVIGYPELGLDAILRITVSKLPAILAVDGFGRNLFTVPEEPPTPDDEIDPPEQVDVEQEDEPSEE
ncbi:MAG TPA: hypothetical protein DCE42_01235 [Myxococcales bacterium]|nr:hypothetical protein [Deltaproteobacteria bacterium]MBU48272.1 hypothetical protein [Deltaproteobacteria bacterium]HAA53345.1 hypothetical protein [Myxococcales bacterium]